MFVQSRASFSHLEEAIEAVDAQVNKSLSSGSSSVKASSGLILTRKNDSGDTEILMGRLYKKDKDEAGVHDSYGLFAGKVEIADVTAIEGVPTVCAAAAREVNEESLGVLNQQNVLNLLQQPTTSLIKNAGWKFFPAASFHVRISKEEGDIIILNFQIQKANIQEHEITNLAWISLKAIGEAQVKKDEEYKQLKEQLEKERGSAFTSEELRNAPELQSLYNRNLVLSDEVKIAHYVARTIFGSQSELDRD